MRSHNRIVLCLALGALAIAAGCSKKSTQKKPTGLGTALVQAPSRNLQVAQGGKYIAAVTDIAKPAEPDAPEGVFQGTLTVTGAEPGAKPRQLGGGVSTLDDGFSFSPDGRHLAFLQGFRFREQAGSLALVKLPDGEVKVLGPTVRYYRFSPDGKWLGYVSAGHMKLLELDTGNDRILAPQTATFVFSRDSKQVLVRQQFNAGGALQLADVAGGDPKKVGDYVGEYDFAPDGNHYAFTSRAGGPEQPYSLFLAARDGAPKRIGDNATTFSFSPDGNYIAYIDGQDPKHPNGDLEVRPVAGGDAKKVGESVVEYRWSPTSNAVAIRESLEDKKGRPWQTLKLATLPGGAERLKEQGGTKPEYRFGFSPDGKHLAYLKPVSGGSIDLMLLEIGGAEPARDVAKGVFGYEFSPNSAEIWYRTGCVRADGRECDLVAAPVAAPGPARNLVSGIWNFKLSANGERMLLTYPRFDTMAAADLGWLDLKAAQPSKGIDSYVLLGAQFLDPSGTKVAYVVSERKREGVYVAELK